MGMEYMNMFRNGSVDSSPRHPAASSFFITQYNPVSQQQRHQENPQQQQVQQRTQQQQGYAFPYSNEQLLVLAQMQQHRNMLNRQAAAAAAASAAAAAAAAGAANGAKAQAGSKQAEPKPRLSKDEVDFLEKEFQKNPKPSTAAKREIADKLKVEQPRINNWFQNRRAKVKSTKKTQDSLARKAAEAAAAAGESSDCKSDDADDENVVSEYYGLSNHQQPVRPSSATFPDDSETKDDEEPRDRQTMQSKRSTIISTTSSPNDGGAMICDDAPLAVSQPPSLSVSHSPFHSEAGSNMNDLDEYPSPKSLPFSHVQTTDLDFAPLAPSFLETQHVTVSAGFPGQTQTCTDDAFLAHHDSLDVASFASPDHHTASVLGMGAFGSFSGEAASSSSSSPSDNNTILAPTPSFPSQLLGRLELHGLKTEADSPPETSEFAGAAAMRPEHPSPNSMPMSPPTPTDLRFKSPPPPANIASRRNKAAAVTQLNATALRGYHYGPKTGLDLKRSDTASPMRRIASATGPGNMAAGIRKASLAGPVPRSPLYLERTKDALMRSLHQSVRSPVLGSINTALSPATSAEQFLSMSAAPAASHNHYQQQLQSAREATASSSASDDEGSRFALHAPSSFFGSLKTPPGTPGLNNGASGFTDQLSAFTHHNGSSASLNTFEAAWNFNPQDEPLVTPGLGSFGSEEFAMASTAPSYVCGGPGVSSQPPTPSFPHNGFGPSSFGAPAGSGYPWVFGPGGPGNTEYTFPDSYVPDASAKSSPGLPPQPKSKQFQFTQNITPSDFNTTK